ncbi:MAG TPA: macro domain-containing protein [Anaerolineae bacterium]|nr:macro domain-containing protein [Anaerolineae bacterium]
MKIGKAKVDILHEDITSVDTDVVVNPANNMLWMGGGISSAIRKAGGTSIETEALSKAPAEIGSAVVTSGGDLKARWVIHAVISGQNLSTDNESIRRAVRASFAKVNEIGCTSIAVPLLNTSDFDIEVHLVARIIVDEMVNFLITENRTLVHVVLMEHDERVKNVFTETLREKFTKHDCKH